MDCVAQCYETQIAKRIHYKAIVTAGLVERHRSCGTFDHRRSCMTPPTAQLLNPERLWSRQEVLSRVCPAPNEPGIYAWYFRDVPGVPIEECVAHGEMALLYVGIAPTVPPRHWRPPSSRRGLFHRIRDHFQRNADCSTLRLTLGCLLSQELSISLRRVGSGRRLTFASGEQRLSDWMDKNAFVTWIVHREPWVLEEELIRMVSLPLNLDMNRAHPFHKTLSAIRSEAKQLARSLPVVASHGSQASD